MPITGVIRRFIYGFLIGSSMLLPGVSGGSMAVILGSYEDIVDTFGNMRSHTARKLIAAACYVVGCIAGLLLLASAAVTLYEKYRLIGGYLFIGAIAACLPPLFYRATTILDEEAEGFVLDGIPIAPSVRRNKHVPIKLASIIAALVGCVCAAFSSFVPADLMDFSGEGFWSFFVSIGVGIIMMLSVALPGIGTEQLLSVFGVSSAMQISVGFVIGSVAGLLLFTGLVRTLVKYASQSSYLLFIGLMVGSVVRAFPGLPHGLGILFAIAALAAGFFAIALLIVFRRPVSRIGDTD